MKNRSALFLLAALLAAAPSTFAREVSLRLLAFDAAAARPACVAHDPASKQPVPGVPAPVKDYLNHEAVRIQLSGPEVLFSKSANPADAAKPDQRIASANLPPAGSQFLLLFLPGADGSARILVIDDSTKAFPTGSYQIFNLSRNPVKLVLENKPFEFASGKSAIITDPPVQENQHSAMYAFSQVDSKWQRIGSGLWPHPGTRRSLQVFHDHPATGRTQLKGFRDVAPPAPPAAE